MAKSRPIGIQKEILVPTEGHSAEGRSVIIARDEEATRIDEVSDTLFYIGYAELGTSEAANAWKIKRIQQVGNVWEQKYAGGDRFYRYRWTERSLLNYF